MNTVGFGIPAMSSKSSLHLFGYNVQDIKNVSVDLTTFVAVVISLFLTYQLLRVSKFPKLENGKILFF